MAINHAKARARLLFELGCSFAADLRLDELGPHVIAKCREVLELEAALQRLRDTQAQLVVQEKLAALGQPTAGTADEMKNPLNS